MSETKPVCEVCGSDSAQSTLVHSVSEGREALFCMRCFHALIHGMSPAQLRERWRDYQSGA